MTVLDRVATKAATAYARLTMASPVYRDSSAQFETTVSRVADLGGGLRRITFTAPEFATFERCGADEYFGLVMARPGAELTLPDGAHENVRAAIAEMPEDVRPNLRWYTIRAHDPATASIDVDVVTHGDSGPGSAWALRAAPGVRAGFRSGGALWRGHECEGPLLVVADETALPAVAAILDLHPDTAGGATIHVEVADPAVLTAYDVITAAPDLHVHVRGGREPGAAVLPALREQAPGHEYAWLCGESGLVTEGRRHLVKAAGMDRRSVLFSGYWKLGQERG